MVYILTKVFKLNVKSKVLNHLNNKQVVLTFMKILTSNLYILIYQDFLSKLFTNNFFNSKFFANENTYFKFKMF